MYILKSLDVIEEGKIKLRTLRIFLAEFVFGEILSVRTDHNLHLDKSRELY